ncbi:DNA internalization-related competence protein ComEC/Rec2 [Ramlibacter sp. PS3R-8]|uniref:DNA internalization-related competence protein ComEC/Rec2 n=1 Tax=Ramlibacter sp. PS3R-8 TaxID=3133437 RepID=UPI00309FF593
MSARAFPTRGAAIAPFLAGVVLGAALQLQQPRLWDWGWYAGGVAAALLALGVLARLRGRAMRWLAIALAATTLSAAATGWRAASFAAGGLDPAVEGRDVVATGLVASLPQRDETGVRFRFQVESVTLDGAAMRLPRHWILGWYGGAEVGADGRAELQRAPAELTPGDRWRFTARLKAPHGHVNPRGFDYELWLWEQGVQATGYVRAGPKDAPPQRLAATWRKPVEQARLRVRDAIFRQVEDARLAGVLAALVVGDQSAIERADWEIFRATGVAHLMSISGLHVTMFAWTAAALVGALWRRSGRLCLLWPAQHAGLAGGVLLAASYALFSGWGVPAQRTVCMLTVVALLRLGARDWPWTWVWLLACAAVVAVDPWALTQAGFWLSFVAVGVLFATGRRADAHAGVGAAQRAWRAFVAMVREQWVVTVALTPLSLLLFGQVSLVGLLANLLAIPWVTLVVTPIGLAGVFVPPLWRAGAVAVDGLAAVLDLLASLPFATWSSPAPPLWAGAAGVAGGILLAARLPWPARLLGLPLLLPVLLWQAPRPAPGAFDVLAADVGQGNAVVVRTAFHTLVYDAGPAYGRDTDAGQRVLVPLLRAGGETVDTLVLSHRDADHTGGAVAVLRMQAQARLLSSLEETHALQALRRSQRCQAGQRWTWDGVEFAILHPAATDYAIAGRPNTLSCVLRVGNGSARVLLAGDVEKAQEALLALDPQALRADLLLVPHHGSKTSSTPAFLDAVRPALAVVQAGYRNRFGHPAAEVMERYRVRNIAVESSPHCGAAAWHSDRPRQLRCERASAPRYWHHHASPPVARTN